MFFDDICFELLKTEPFYAHMLRQCRIKIDNKFPAAAGVIVKRGIEMVLNKEQLLGLPIEEQAGIIAHELEHLFHDHIADYHRVGSSEADSVGKRKSHKAFNLAADAQINTRIKAIYNSEDRGIKQVRKVNELGKQHGFGSDKFKEAVEGLKSSYAWIFPETFDMKDGEHWTTYYKGLLLKYQADPDENDQMKIYVSNEQDGESDNDKQDGNSEGDQDGDGKGMPNGGMPKDHSHQYFELSIEDQQILDEIISKAVKEAKEMNFGNCPSRVDEYLIEVENRKKLPWHVILRQFVAAQISIIRRSTWKKSNRRFPEQLPGNKREPKLKVLIGLDASGSVGDKEWAAFVNEINGIYAQGCEVWIAEFDTEIANYYKYKGAPEKRCTNGGTDFRPVHKKVIDEKFNALIMLTDGFGSFPDKKEVTYKSLWVIDGDYKAPYGHTIKLEVPGK